MAFGELPQALREVDEGRALSSVRAAEADDCDLCKSPCIGLEHGVDERSSADADGSDVRGGYRSERKHLPHCVLDTRRDIGRRRRLELCEHTPGRLVHTAHIDEHSIRVCPWDGQVWLAPEEWSPSKVRLDSAGGPLTSNVDSDAKHGEKKTLKM